MSLPGEMTGRANLVLARTLAEEWAHCGVRDAVICPGSRSTPLALALAQQEGIDVHVQLDERSGAFFALGLAKSAGRPAVAVCTSGTAAANFHPAVLESGQARVPLILCTADRPRELRETGAGQTVDQVKLYGSAVRWFFEADPPADAEGEAGLWSWLASRSFAESVRSPAGPVHLNLAFREPLVPEDLEGVAVDPERPRRSIGRQPRLVPDDSMVDSLAEQVRASPRGVVVAGWGADVSPATVTRFARLAGWPVLADPLSGLRCGRCAISTYDALVRIEAFRKSYSPDMVLQLGGPLTSRRASEWLAGSPSVLVDPHRAWRDPHRAARHVLDVEPEPLLSMLADRTRMTGGEPWLDRWLDAESVARGALDAHLDASDDPFEGRVARDVMSALPDGSSLVVASSMPVRDLESFAAPRSGVRVLANRGANGIDGFVSTVLGVAAGSHGAPTVALLGDLCLLHDSNGLLGARGRGVDAVYVVVDNDGGGIFSFLPQVRLSDHFEELFGTPHRLDLERLAELNEVPFADVHSAAELAPALVEAIARWGVRMVRVRTDRSTNVSRHEAAFDAVEDRVRSTASIL